MKLHTQTSYSEVVQGARTVRSVLVVFDQRVQDLDTLYSALLPGAIAYTLNDNDDALLMITQLLAETGVKQLAIVAHGEPGVVQIGANPLNLEQLQAKAHLLQEWGVEEIALYSCEVGQDVRFVAELERLSGAKVAAATGKVGAAAQGGSWEFDIGTYSQPFNPAILWQYPAVLAITGLTVNGTTWNNDSFINSAEDNSITISGSVNQTGTSGQDVLLVVWGTVSGTRTALYWRTIDRNSDTGSWDTTLNLETILGTSYQGLLTFEVYQGTASGNGNSGNYTGTPANIPGRTGGGQGATNFSYNSTTLNSGNSVNSNTLSVSSSAYTFDTAAPTVAVTDNVPGTANLLTTSIAYTYTFNEVVTGLTADDFTVTNGTIISITGSGTAYTINVTPTPGIASGNISLALRTNAVTDAAGNSNTASTNNTQAIDTVAPTITSGNAGTVAENAATTTVIYTAAATDAGSITYSLSGTDAGLLNINPTTGVVTLKNSADFETKSSYSFNVVATDAAGNASAPRAVVVSVTNVDEVAPTITSVGTGSVAENAAVSTVIYTATATDTDFAPGTQSITYSLSGTDAALLNINSSTGIVTLKNSADFETKSSYSFNVVATDAAGNASAPRAVVVSVTNVDEVAPTITSVGTGSVAENAAVSTVIYTATATDTDFAPGTQSITYSLSGTDAVLLNINSSTGVVTLKNSADFETRSSYSFNVLATDAAGNASAPRAVVVSVTNVDEVAPTITSGATGSINENVPAGTVIYTATATDSADISAGVTFSLSGADAGLLEINPTTGAVGLKSGANYEAKNSYSFTVLASDGVTPATSKDVTISVNNLDEVAPTITSGTTSFVDENAAAGALIYTATATDADFAPGTESITYSLSGTDAALLNIDPATGAVTLKDAANYEVKASYSFSVIATDAAGNVSEPKAVTVNVNNLDEVAPTITSGDGVAITENAAAGALIYTATATDTDFAPGTESITYSLSGTDAALLNIDPATGAVTLKDAANYEVKASYSFSVIATDAAGNASEPKAVTVDVNNLDEVAPTITSGDGVAITENAAVSTVIYTATATDTDFAPGTESITYSLSGTDAALLNIDPATGAVTLKDAANYEAKTSYSFSVIATDAAGNASEPKAVTVDVNNLDEVAPTITSGDGVAINENAAAGALIYTATATDTDFAPGTESITYSLSGTDAALLSIDPATGAVTLKDAANYEAKTSYSFSVIATDAAGNVSEPKAITVNVNNLDEVAPTITSGIASFVDENAAGALIYTATATDTDFAPGTESITYSLSGTDAALLSIDPATGAVTLKDAANYEAKTSYSFSVIATDAAGNVSEPKAVTVNVNNLDEVAPTITSGTTSFVDENQNTLYTVAAIDTDFNTPATVNSVTYSLKSGVGDANLLSIDPATGVVTLASGNLDYETKPSYSFTVIATDAVGNTREQVITVNVNDINEIPVDTTPPDAPVIAAVATDNIVNSAEKTASIVVSGTAEAGSTVNVTWGSTTLTTTADTAGNWSRTFTSAQVPGDGTTTISATATDAAGNTSTTSTQLVLIDTLAPTAPTINPIGGTDSTVSSVAGDAGITGTAEAGSTVTLRFGNTVLGTVTSDTTGSWSYTLTPENITAIGQGSGKSITATATDAAGNIGLASAPRTFAVDTIAPNSPAIINVTDNVGTIQGPVANGVSTNDTSPTFVISLANTGAVPGNRIRLFNGSTQIATLTINATHIAAGSVAITPATLMQGSYSITATITDAAGNQSLASTPRTFTIDTTAPADPVLNVVAGDNRINAAEKGAGVTVSGTAEVNSTVNITWGTTTLATTADASGNWSRNFTSVQIPADGTTTLSVRAIDAAGNPSAPITRSILVDTIVPVAVANTISSLSSDTGTLGDFITNAATQTVRGSFTGRLTTGESIQVSADGGTTWRTATLNTANNTWSAANVTLQAGANTLITRTVDVAGNVTSGASRAYTLDQIAPVVSTAIASLSTDTGAAGDFITNVASQTVTGAFTGTLAAGESIQVSANGGTNWVTAVTNGSNWTASGITLLTGADRQLTTRVIDAAGNVTAGASRAYTLDTTAPVTPAITGYTATSIIGTAEANATVLLSTSASNPTSFATAAVANATGNYTLDLASLVGSTSGTSYYLYSQDVAGNISTAASARRVVVGTGGADSLTGAGGNASDLLVGGAGTDTAAYAATNGAIALTGQINSATGSVNINTANIDVLTGMEALRLTGTAYTGLGNGTNQLRNTVQTALTNNSIAAFTGVYNASSGAFTFGVGAGQTANATLIAFDANAGNGTNYEAFLLLGKTTPTGAISLNAGAVTLGNL
ncbi:cadherin domain-containing protein [Leptolyngbya sp. PL-A3]|uniref:cadherin domain-containing protein n=1 Tax=Leptolyngbya sp. PL-A3 TaxID=2933911 RepID=UPI003299D22D